MVEIKRTAAGNSFKERRIGVVNVSTGAERVAEQKAAAYKSFSDSMFQETVALQKQAGKEAAKKAITVDPETGIIKVSKPPAIELGAFGQAEFANDVQRQYAISAENDIRANIKSFSAMADGDSEKFTELWTSFKKERREAIESSGGQDYVEEFDRLSSQFGAAATAQLKIDKFKNTQRKAQTAFYGNITDSNADMTSYFSNGLISEGEEKYKETKTKIESNKNLTDVQAAGLIQKLSSARAVGGVKGSLGDSVTASQLSNLVVEAAKRNWSEDTLKKFPDLKRFSKFTSVEWDNIESDLRTLSSSVSKNEQAQIATESAFNAVYYGSPSKEQISLVEKASGVSLREVLTKGYGQQVTDFVNKTNKLPSEIISFNDRILNADPQILEGMPDEQILPFIKNAEAYSTIGTEFGNVQRDLGMSDASIIKLNFLSKYIATNGDASVKEGIRYMNALSFDVDARDKFIQLYGADAEKEIKKGDNNFTIATKLLAKKRPEIPASIRTELLPAMMQSLQLSETPTQAFAVFDEFVETTYSSKSKYMASGEVTRYSPEKMFIERFKLPEIIQGQALDSKSGESDFEKVVNHFIKTRGFNLEIGKNAFFKVDKTQTDDKQTVYFVYDEMGNALTRNGNPIVFNTNRLSHIVKKAEMSEAYYTKIEKKVRQTDAERLRDAKRSIDEFQARLLLTQGM